MSLLLLFVGADAPVAVVPPPPTGVSPAETMTPSRLEGRRMRAYRQSLADEDALLAFLASLL